MATVIVYSKLPQHIRAGVEFKQGRHSYELDDEQLERVGADPHLKIVDSALADTPTEEPPTEEPPAESPPKPARKRKAK